MDWPRRLRVETTVRLVVLIGGTLLLVAIGVRTGNAVAWVMAVLCTLLSVGLAVILFRQWGSGR